TIVLMILGFVLASTSAAQAVTLNHTWVASNGIDGTSCGTRAAPCASFTQAITHTAAGGEGSCADAGTFGPIRINKALTINCESVGSTTTTNGTIAGGLFVNLGGDVVTVRGVDIDALNSCDNATTQVAFLGAGTLNLEKVKVRNCASGIFFSPTGAAQLM